MKELTRLITEATAGISESYFRLNIDGGDPAYRERVYCYELYHQLRVIWPETEYYLNGEVDKAGHPKFKRMLARGSKPDLLVHRPGYMKGNHTIIEVKTEEAHRGDIKKDIEKLSLFVNEVGYKRAIYLFFGYGLNDSDLLQVIKRESCGIEGLAPIEIWFHDSHDKPATKKVEMIGADL